MVWCEYPKQRSCSQIHERNLGVKEIFENSGNRLALIYLHLSEFFSIVAREKLLNLLLGMYWSRV